MLGLFQHLMPEMPILQPSAHRDQPEEPGHVDAPHVPLFRYSHDTQRNIHGAMRANMMLIESYVRAVSKKETCKL